MSNNIDIILPADQLEGTEAKLSAWLVECGAEVSKGDPILELETDKVSMEICAPDSGRLIEIQKQSGDDVGPDSVLGRIAKSASESTDVPPSPREMSTPTPTPSEPNTSTGEIDIVLPAEQLEGTTAKLSSWLVECGTEVRKGDPILELETDKVAMEVCAPEDGVVREMSKHPGDEVDPGTVLGKLSTGQSDRNQQVAEAPVERTLTQVETTSTAATPINDGSARHLTGPAVRRLLREHSLDITLISGTGRNGRVTRNDVLDYVKNPKPIQPPVAATSAAVGSMASQKIPHTNMRKAIANHMVESLLHTSPHVTSVFEMDMSNIIEHRRWHKREFADEGVKLTFTAYFLAATVKAMAAVPQMNARYHEDALEIFNDINIGVGTALGDDGLVVPVVKQVQKKKLLDIARALHDQTDRARNGKLTPADMKHGTFTISNHGVSGSLFAAPIIINQPQVAILGIGKLEKRVTVVEQDGKDTMVVKPKCYVSLSIDHRAVDAFQTNKFLSVFVDCIENWGN